MPNIFMIADTHFTHSGVVKFLNNDGTKLRPWDNVEEMDEALVENWNKVVQPKDKVYHLGGVVINRKALRIMERLNGKKVLIRGNHDIFRLEEYTPYFYDIRGSHKLDNFILSHIPIHENSVARWCGGIIHGHLHNERVTKWIDDPAYDDMTPSDFICMEQIKVIDPRYYCVSVEQINYTPIAFEDLKILIKKQQ